MEKIQSESLSRLYRIIAAVQSAEECKALLLDLCTVGELEDMAQRLDAAFLLESGANYQEISEGVGLSTATISRVSKALKYGEGYRAAIAREKEAQKNGEEAQA